MDSLHSLALESNRQMKINFDGGDLSSDAGLLLVKEFACKLGFVKMLKSMFKTKDTARLRRHKDDENLWQMIYQILGAYFEDDCADEFTNDPVLTAILDKKALASQPTLSRFFNRMDESTLEQFYALMRRFAKLCIPSRSLCFYWRILIPHFLTHMGIRRVKDLTSITGATVTIHWSVTMV